MDGIKKCSKCRIISLNSIFHKDKTKNDGIKPKCKVFREESSRKIKILIRDETNNFYLENGDRMNNNQNL